MGLSASMVAFCLRVMTCRVVAQLGRHTSTGSRGSPCTASAIFRIFLLLNFGGKSKLSTFVFCFGILALLVLFEAWFSMEVYKGHNGIKAV